MLNNSLRPEVDGGKPMSGVRPIAASRRLFCRPAQVFDLLDRPRHLELFHPFCRSNSAISWSGGARQDVISYLNGLTYVRNFVAWRHSVGFDLLIGEAGQSQSFVGWRLKPAGEASSELSITVYPHLVHGLSPVVGYPVHMLWLKPRLQQYLTAVLSGLQCYLLTRTTVSANAFGSHPWFSQ